MNGPISMGTFVINSKSLRLSGLQTVSWEIALNNFAMNGNRCLYARSAGTIVVTERAAWPCFQTSEISKKLYGVEMRQFDLKWITKASIKFYAHTLLTNSDFKDIISMIREDFIRASD